MNNKKLLVLDTAFTYEIITTRKLQSSVTCRDLGGFFEHVWSVHPFASLVSTREWGPEFGRPDIYSVAETHTCIEGKIGFSRILKRFSRINFIFAQIDIFIVLLKRIRNEKITVIRVGDPLYLGIFGYFLSRFSGVPFVVRVGANNEKIRETTGKCIMPRLFKTMNQERMVEKFVLSRADLIAGANKDNLNYAISCGAKLNKCTLFRYGNLIDPKHFVPPDKRTGADPKYLIHHFLMCIARLEPVKKVEDVIRVLAEARKKDFDVHALLVGDGSEKESIEKLAKQLGVLEQVVFCGNRDQNWLSAMIPHATVIISPHTGRALTEAALGGVAIAAYDVDWQAELIETGVTGELVTFGDWNALSLSTIKLLSDKTYAQSVGMNLRKRVLEMMDPDKLDEHERQQYQKLLETNSKN